MRVVTLALILSSFVAASQGQFIPHGNELRIAAICVPRLNDSQGDLHHQQRGGVASLVVQDY